MAGLPCSPSSATPPRVYLLGTPVAVRTGPSGLLRPFWAPLPARRPGVVQGPLFRRQLSPPSCWPGLVPVRALLSATSTRGLACPDVSSEAATARVQDDKGLAGRTSGRALEGRCRRAPPVPERLGSSVFFDEVTLELDHRHCVA